MLKEENDSLRDQLKEMNRQIDLLLEKEMNKPIKPPRTETNEKVKQNYQRTIATIEKEVKSLRKSDRIDNLEKKQSVEQDMNEAEQKLRDIRAEIKGITLRLHSSGKKLVNTEEDPESTKEVKRLTKELERAQADYRQLETNYNRQLAFHESVKGKIEDFSRETEKLPKNLEVQPQPTDNSEITSKKQEILNFISEKNSVQFKYRKRLDELNAKLQEKAKNKTKILSQSKGHDATVKSIETQLRVTRQQIKNLTRNPDTPALIQADISAIHSTNPNEDQDVNTL